MRRIIREIGEERFTRLVTAFHKSHRLVGKIIDAKALALHNFPVVLQWRAKVIAPVPRAKAVKLLKPSPIWVIRVLHAIVPFAESARGITGRLEGIGDGLFIEIHPLTAGRGAVHARAHMIAPGQKLRARRRTHCAHKEPIKPRPFPRKRINVGRGQVRIAVEAEIAPTLVVREDDDHVGLACNSSKR